MKNLWAIVAPISFLVLVNGCSNSAVTIPTTPAAPGDQITLTAKLTTTRGKSANPGRNQNRSAQARSSVVGATLLCATLTNPPVSGSGVVDSDGNVTVNFKGAQEPFGCFLTPADSAVSIPLVFGDGSSTGTMAVASANLSLGNVSVTTDGTGAVVASATLPTAAALQTTTPPGLSCLSGTWSATTSDSCNGDATSYNLFFTPLPDGSYANSFVENNGVTNTIHLTGTTTPGSRCVTVSSTDGLEVGQNFSDISAWMINPGGAGIIPEPGTTISSLTACGAGQIQLSQPAAGNGAPVSDNYLVTVCGTTAHNTKDVVYNATDSTVSLTYPKLCTDVAVDHLTGGAWSAVGAGFIADLTSGSKCLGGLQFPSVLAVNNQVTDADNSNTYFTAGVGTKISAIPGTCAGGFQMSVNANASGTALLKGYNLSGPYSSFNFYGTVTSGSPCVTPTLPTGLTGYFVGDSAAAISAAAGTGVTLVAATSPCSGPYMLSEAASSKATTGESIIIIPANTGLTCTMGICFDATGNAYSGAATCPSGTAALTAQTEIDTMPINADCSRLWASESYSCVVAFDSDASLAAHCGSGQNTSNTPLTAVRSRYAQTNTGCAGCYPNINGATADYPINGCVGYGNVTCTANRNGLMDSNIVMIKQ